MSAESMQFDSFLESEDLPYKMKLKLHCLEKKYKDRLSEWRDRIENKSDFSKYGENDEKIVEQLMNLLEENAQLKHIYATHEWISQHAPASHTIIEQEIELNLQYVLLSFTQYTVNQVAKQESIKRLYLLHILRVMLLAQPISSSILEVIRSNAFVTILIRQIDPEQVEISCLALKILTFLIQGRPEGLALVMESLEKLRSELKKESKFALLSEHLSASKSSILVLTICSFIEALNNVSQLNAKTYPALINDFKAGRVFESLQEVYNRIKKGQYLIEGNSFEKEKYDDVPPAELFFAIDFMRRSHPTPFFHRKPKDEQLFDKTLQSIYKLIKAFMQKQQDSLFQI